MNMQRLARKIESEYVGTEARVTPCGAAVDVWEVIDESEGLVAYVGRVTYFNAVADMFSRLLGASSVAVEL